jgi:hypothetical protein
MAVKMTQAYIMLPQAPVFDLRQSDFTLSIFLKGPRAGNRNWFTKANTIDHYYGLGGNDKAVLMFDGGPGGFAVSTTDVFDDVWHHVTGVRRGSTLEIWIDGIREGTGVITPNHRFPDSEGRFGIGQDGDCRCEYFTGQFDEARIWNRALSPEEIWLESQGLKPESGVVVTQTGFVRNRATGEWVSSLTLTNTGSSPTGAPLYLVLSGLPSGVSVVNQNGNVDGKPFITVASPSLAVGASISVAIRLLNTTNGYISYSPNVYSAAP